VVRDLKALAAKLRHAGFSIKTPRSHEMNTIYDLPGERLRRRGELLRLRKYGGTWTLTHKARSSAGRHKSRQETESRIEDGGKLDGILRALGFAPTFRYEKFRTEWSDGAGQVVVDETPIGNLAEIEGGARWIDQTAKKLGVLRDSYITQTYAELFRDWKRHSGSGAKEMTFRGLGRKR